MNDNSELTYFNLSDSIKGLFNGVLNIAFKILSFFIKNWIVVLLLLIIGGVWGYFSDKREKYEYETIVVPNFNSSNYLYETVDLLNNKLKTNDSLFFIENELIGYKGINKIRIEPIIDIYELSNNRLEKDDKLEIMKLMTKDISMNEIIEGKISEKSYLLHKIIISSRKKINADQVFATLLTYLNDSPFYKNLKDIYLENSKIQIEEIKLSIKQIDEVLAGLSYLSEGKNSNQLIYYNENKQVNDLIWTKNKLLNDLLHFEQAEVYYQNVINSINTEINIGVKRHIFPRTILYPLALIVLFSLLFGFFSAFRKFLSTNK